MNTSSESTTETGSTEEPAKNTPDRQALFTFIIISLALLMWSIDSTIVAVSVPAFLDDLHTNLAMVAWTLTGYQFSQSIIMPIVGKLGDDLGRKRLFLAAVVIFTVSSMAAGLSPNILWLIVFRVLQGIGGGAFLPLATGIISDTFRERRAQAIGLTGSIFPLGGILGPNIGGFIVDNFSWRWIFFVNVPIGVALLIFGAKLLPKGREANGFSSRQLDILGVGLFIGAVLAVLYAITDWANRASAAGIMTPVLFAVGGILFALFLYHEERTDQPMIDAKLLRGRPFVAVNVYNFIYGAVVFGLVSFIPYYATVAYGMTAGQDGLLLTPRSVTVIIASAITSVYIIRFRYRVPMIIGLVLTSLSFLLLSRGYHDVAILGLDFNNLALLASLVAIAGVGIGVANPAANNAALDLIPEKVAAIAGMRGMARSIGGVIGTAVTTLILSYFSDQARGMQDIYIGSAVLLLLLIPIVFMIPDSVQQRRKHPSPANGEN